MENVLAYEEMTKSEKIVADFKIGFRSGDKIKRKWNTTIITILYFSPDFGLFWGVQDNQIRKFEMFDNWEFAI